MVLPTAFACKAPESIREVGERSAHPGLGRGERARLRFCRLVDTSETMSESTLVCPHVLGYRITSMPDRGAHPTRHFNAELTFGSWHAQLPIDVDYGDACMLEAVSNAKSAQILDLPQSWWSKGFPHVSRHYHLSTHTYHTRVCNFLPSSLQRTDRCFASRSVAHATVSLAACTCSSRQRPLAEASSSSPFTSTPRAMAASTCAQQ